MTTAAIQANTDTEPDFTHAGWAAHYQSTRDRDIGWHTRLHTEDRTSLRRCITVLMGGGSLTADEQLDLELAAAGLEVWPQVVLGLLQGRPSDIVGDIMSRLSEYLAAPDFIR